MIKGQDIYRALQKRLFLDLIGLIDLDRYFEKHLQDYFNEKEEILKLDDAIQCLISIFELIHRNEPNLLKNVSLAVDLALNLLLVIVLFLLKINLYISINS